MRNHLGLTAKQSAFVARGGMRLTKIQKRKLKVYGPRGPYAARSTEPTIKSGEFRGLTESTAAQILALREYFQQSSK